MNKQEEKLNKECADELKADELKKNQKQTEETLSSISFLTEIASIFL